jgi:hypothetical protein|tara:strand:+ start:324 stop:599 length:276 start_codon:yes stop_codon:yes gene_type:complete
MVSKIDAIRELYSGQYNKATEESIEWKDGHTTTDAEKTNIDTKFAELQVIQNRKNEYPTIEELVVALYDTDDKADIETKRAAVKAKYPKPA